VYISISPLAAWLTVPDAPMDTIRLTSTDTPWIDVGRHHVEEHRLVGKDLGTIVAEADAQPGLGIACIGPERPLLGRLGALAGRIIGQRAPEGHHLAVAQHQIGRRLPFRERRRRGTGSRRQAHHRQDERRR